MIWQPSGIDFDKALAEFRSFSACELSEPEYVARLQSCGKCSLCRQGKCLTSGQCVHRKARAEAETCPKGFWESDCRE
jgi:hypothetical protein